MGLLDPEELFEELRRNQLERLIELCAWRSGSYKFFTGRIMPGDGPFLSIAVPDLLVTVANEMGDEMLLDLLSPWLERIPSLVAGALFERLMTSEADRTAVQQIDGVRSAKELIAAAGADVGKRHAVVSALFLLSQIGAVEWRER